LTCEHRIEIVPDATRLCEESGTLEEVTHLAIDWFGRWLADATPRVATASPVLRSVSAMNRNGERLLRAGGRHDYRD
jgi:hypothetical protein